MFEDALVESSGRLRSKSRVWALLTFFLNLAVVAALVLLPLLHPGALPKSLLTPLFLAPPLPIKPVQDAEKRQSKTKAPIRALETSASVPHHVPRVEEPAAPAGVSVSPDSAMADRETVVSGRVMDVASLIATTVVIARAKEAERSSGRSAFPVASRQALCSPKWSRPIQ